MPGFFQAVAEDFRPTVIDEDHPGIGIGHRDPFRRGLHDATVLLLALPQRLLAAFPFLQKIPDLALLLSYPRRHLQGAGERRDAYRPVEDQHIAKLLHRLLSHGGLDPAGCHEQNGQVRPFRLTPQGLRQDRQCPVRQRLLRQQHRVRLQSHLPAQVPDVGADHRLGPNPGQNILDDGDIFRCLCVQQHATG